jgi:hypothetical protein
MAIKVDYSTIANCRPEHVWRVFEDLSRWSSFEPEAIAGAHWTQGEPWKPGSKFAISLRKPTTINLIPEVTQCEPPIFFQLRAGGAGVKGEAGFVFKLLPDGRTEIRTLQEFSGAPLLMFGNKVKIGVEKGLAIVFERLKAEAEAEAQKDAASNSSA